MTEKQKGPRRCREPFRNSAFCSLGAQAVVIVVVGDDDDTSDHGSKAKDVENRAAPSEGAQFACFGDRLRTLNRCFCHDRVAARPIAAVARAILRNVINISKYSSIRSRDPSIGLNRWQVCLRVSLHTIVKIDLNPTFRIIARLCIVSLACINRRRPARNAHKPAPRRSTSQERGFPSTAQA